MRISATARATFALSLAAALAACGSAPPASRPAVDPSAPTAENSFLDQGRAEVEAILRHGPDRRRAQNVILFVGDGMGVSTVTAARILGGQLQGRPGEENALSFERFPEVALSKTYQANQQVSDSAPTMTAMVTGSKANEGALSVAPSVRRDDFAAAARPENRLRTILEQAESRGLWTGIVSTARVTHATPGACYAHSPDRDAESDAELARISPAAAAAGFPDIARQLVDFEVRPTRMNGRSSRGLEVALGGGRSRFLPAGTPDPEYPEIPQANGQRLDGDLTEVWRGHGGVVVYDRAGFDAVDPAATGPVLGLFQPSHMRYELDRNDDPGGEPSLAEMTEKALRILERGPEGYFLMVEAGRIDHAHHEGNAIRALHDTLELARAVERAVRLAGDDTLIVVTADHSHVFTLAGYPTRGNPILGLVVENDEVTGLPLSDPVKALDGKPYTTLGYMNGPGAVQGPRPDLSGVDTAAPGFLQQALIPRGSETHGGEDVAIYARGPHAHLFRGTMEQHSIYWVMTKALGWW
jgi:alkaline phosphatase